MYIYQVYFTKFCFLNRFEMLTFQFKIVDKSEQNELILFHI